MISELGHFALIAALMLAGLQCGAPIIAKLTKLPTLNDITPACAFAQLLCLIIAFGALMNAHITSDFSLKNVYDNSHTLMPILYKVVGVWGNHEGSLLLWVLCLSAFGGLAVIFSKQLPRQFRIAVIATQGAIGFGFLAFLVFTSNPFARIWPLPIEGRDLNPLLQDPGLASHPPILYMGYVGLSIVYSFAVAALIHGRIDVHWARFVRPWALLAWAFLTAGIGLGSWWAYYELGWGGFWFWDPVENASFMPWLFATALLHSAIVSERRNLLHSWTILLAIGGFSFSLIGAFIVRSGVLTSVHAFATDPERGLFILLLLVIAIGGSLALYGWRASTMAKKAAFAPVSRESAILLNNLFIIVGTITVLLGTVYPLLADVLWNEKLSVGPQYFNASFVPIMLAMIVILGFAPLIAWKRGNLANAARRLQFAAIAALLTLVISYALAPDKIGAAFGIAIAVWLSLAVLADLQKRINTSIKTPGQFFQNAIRLPRNQWGSILAHFGVAVFIAGATGATQWQQELITSAKIGETVRIGHYEMRLESVDLFDGPNYIATRGQLHILNSGQILQPEVRRYLSGDNQTTEAAIHSNLWRDLYAVLGNQTGDNSYVLRIYIKPLALLLWLGVAFMALGGFFAMTDRHKNATLREEK